MLMQSDHLRSQIGKCGEDCDIEDEGLCPECCITFEKVMDEDKRLAGSKEFTDVLRKLKKACDKDTTGNYQRILNQHRDVKGFH